MGAPSEASTKQLRELHIRTNLPNKSFGSSYRLVATINDKRHSGACVTRGARHERARNP